MMRRGKSFTPLLLSALSVIGMAFLPVMSGSPSSGWRSVGLVFADPGTSPDHATPEQLGRARKQAIAAGLTDAQMTDYLELAAIVSGGPLRAPDRRFIEADTWLRYLDRAERTQRNIVAVETLMKNYRKNVKTPYQRASFRDRVGSEIYCAPREGRDRQLAALLYRDDPVVVDDCASSRRVVRRSSIDAAVALHDLVAAVAGRPRLSAGDRQALRADRIREFKDLPNLDAKDVFAFAARNLAAAKKALRDATPKQRAEFRSAVAELKTQSDLFVAALALGHQAHTHMSSSSTRCDARCMDRLYGLAPNWGTIHGLSWALHRSY